MPYLNIMAKINRFFPLMFFILSHLKIKNNETNKVSIDGLQYRKYTLLYNG